MDRSGGSVKLQLEIEQTFSENAFSRPLFYSYPGGLRFELSEKGSAIEQFLLAQRKATEICGDLFIDDETLVVCLKDYTASNCFGNRRVLKSLNAAGVYIPEERSIWCEKLDPDDGSDDNEPEYWTFIAFEAPVSLIPALLWCALVKDFGEIRPKPGCDVYLFNIKKGIMALPYDDRGMDVVGPNKALLSALYNKHHQYLLEHDRAEMDATFGEKSDTGS